MSERNQEQIQGHWESQSYAAKTTKIGDNPSVTEGRKASAEGTFDEVRKNFQHYFIFLFIIIYYSAVNQ
jgi:hypothetical protein